MADLTIVPFRPDPSQYAWTFSGAAPVMRIQPGTVLELWSENCFALRVSRERGSAAGVTRTLGIHPSTSHEADEPRSSRNTQPWGAAMWSLESPLPDTEPLDLHCLAVWPYVVDFGPGRVFCCQSSDVEVDPAPASQRQGPRRG